MKTKGIIIIMLFVSINTLISQSDWVNKIPDVDTVFAPVLTGNYFIEKRNYVGDQYLNSQWAEGDILLCTDQLLRVKSLKYNGLHDELIWLNNLNLNTFKIDKAYIKEFWLRNIQGRDLHFKRIKFPVLTTDSVTDMLTEVLTEGVYSLYKQHSITTQWPQYKVIDKIRVKYDVLKYTPFYLIKTPPGQVVKLTHISRKNLNKLLPAEERRINNILRKEEFILRDEGDLIRLINGMNL